MHYIRYFIDHIIDLEMSKKHRKFIVKTGVDPELDECIFLSLMNNFYSQQIHHNFLHS